LEAFAPLSEKELADWDHRDPFDRMLAAQATIEDAALMSADPVFAGLPALRLLW
jgi:PIN domain nuclease of toxin-antitoxin system